MEILKQARKRHGLTIRELARMKRIQPSQLCEMEHGKRNLPKDKDKLADLLFILEINPADVVYANDLNKAIRQMESLRDEFGVVIAAKAFNIVFNQF